MFHRTSRLCRGALVAACLSVSSLEIQAAPSDSVYSRLSAEAPGLESKALRHALDAMQCAVKHGAPEAQRLAVIDYSQPSTARRLWLFDLEKQELLLRDYVAHGRRSGENFATDFSNTNGSFQTSLGLFRTAETYRGKHGYSLRMDGLEPGLNDNARERAIVIHAADYVDPALVKSQGRIGRSLGCPAVRPEIAQMVIDNLEGGQFMYAWHSDSEWREDSAHLNCNDAKLLTASKH